MKSSTIRAGRVAALAIALVACTADRLIAPSATVNSGTAALTVVMPNVRISEFHYDNTGADVDERVEISGPAGMDVTGWKVIPYNGANGQSYTPTGTFSGAFPATCGTRGVMVVAVSGLQNGAPDGMALVNNLNQVIEFLSYEGTFAATNGAASGLTSVDVGAAENGDEPVGGSLQRDGSGLWTKTTGNTFGACNDDGGVVTPPAEVASIDVTPSPAAVNVGGTTQLTAVARDADGQPVSGTTFTWSSTAPAATVNTTGLVTGVSVGSATIKATAPNGVIGSTDVTVSQPAGSAGHVRVSEFHYDNAGVDADEKIELEGDAGGSLNGWKLVLYSGSPGSTTIGQSYATISLSGTFGSACTEGTRGVLTFPAVGLQNGDNDGFALVDAGGQVVEFLSYEGSFAAVNGPAAGMTATDVGVSEANAPAVGRSLQRAGNGTWFGPFPSTFDACNAATPPAPVTGITFTGRSPVDDAPLPVGYQDQLFATLRDENTGASVPTTFTWTSDTPDIATVDQRGEFRALAAGNAIIRATAANGVTNTTTLPTEVAALGNQSLYRDPLAFGVPDDGTPFDELRVSRPQYQLSYNQAMGRPNWAAYHLSTTVRGDLPGYRCDCFTADPAVSTMDYPGLSGADYTNSGFDRGHMVRSNDRELAHGEQATTYYMSNIVPQYGALNQHRWAAFEDYLQTVADGATHPEVYIVTGPRGNVGTIAAGRVAIPTATWKVAVVLPAGMTPDQVHAKTDIIDVIAVDMPNISTLPQDTQWQLHRTTVDAVEAASGYDLFSALPDPLEAILESGDHEPTARIAGAGLSGGSEGQLLAFDGFTSSDPDLATLNDVLSYSWSVNGVAAGNQASFTHAFADNGAFSVRLIVTDKFGAADTASATVTVSNVAPTLNAFAGATILRGETYTAAGTFSDPGADTFTGTVSYGDGTGTNPLSLGSASFSLSHVYATAGTYTVTVAVGDDDGGSSTATATVTVVSAATAIGTLSNSVAALEQAGTISHGEANALDASLKNALKSVEKGNPTPAANQLGAFINKVEAMRGSGRISAATAQALIDYANRIIAAMSS